MLPASVRASADLDPGAVRRGDQIRASAEMFLEEPSEAARLRHRQPARLRAGAACDVRHGARFGESETGGREAPVQFTHLARLDPAKEQVLV